MMIGSGRGTAAVGATYHASVSRTDRQQTVPGSRHSIGVHRHASARLCPRRAPCAPDLTCCSPLCVCVSTCLCVHSWPSQGELEDEDEDNDGVPRRLSFCEDAEMAVQLMTDKTLENVIMDDLLQKWTPAQLHHR